MTAAARDVGIEPAGGEALAGISSMAMRQVLAEAAEAWQRESGARVVVESVGGVDARRRIEAGEAFDFVVLAREVIDALAAAGHVDTRSRVDLARAGVAIAVQSGAARFDIASEQALRDAVMAARSVGYSTGPSGAHVTRLLAHWGVRDGVGPRPVQAPPGVPVGALVARGEVAIGFQQLPELVGLPGVDVVGMLPPSIQQVTSFAGAVCTGARRAQHASAFLAFAASAQASDARRRHGMDDATPAG